MKSASNTPNVASPRTAAVLPDEPPGGVTAGLDWARDDHAVAVVDERGRERVRHRVEHSAAGLRELIETVRGAGCGEVAIERPDGPVVDALFAAGLTVVVISPNQVKNLRGRYGSAGNKDDRFDAYVLADTLRTDRARLRPLVPDTAQTISLRRAVRARKDLVSHRVGVANQLRAHLRNAFPGAVGLFAEIDSPISLAFLTRFDTQDRADWLSPKRLAAWLSSVGYSGRSDPAVLHTGRVRAARLLAEIGDCRAKFPTPESLACLAGAAPSTRQSGKLRTVGFRWSCDKQLRDAVIDFAADSRRTHPWAADLYNRARARGHNHPHAARILARAWLYVIWHCWQNNLAYDPTQHGALQRLLQDQQAAA
ncbi:MAG: transposase [Pseudonocardiaceae bacterium]|nr:transposase [Pseudonocardiaceae bacterium]